ncbi:MAG: ATP-binding protein [Candidatus Bathyarchaeota archaeon]|nr:ATP-binding protein [Candidatus Bathyarchaeota archaeon]
MLFDPRPKESLEDLFDREEEVKLLRKTVNTPITLLLGVRRVGKTSLLKAFLNSLETPHLYLDLRVLEEGGYSRAQLYKLLSSSVSNCTSRWRRILEFFRSVKGVRISGFEVEFDWRERALTLTSILDKLNDYALETEEGFIVISLDEAQILRFLEGGKGRIDFRSILAYAYDNLGGLRFILTGSEVGLLLGFLRLDDASSPLYGRYISIIRVEKFPRKLSIEFLRKGFSEANLDVSEDILEAIVDRVDGIVGWLTFFGYTCLKLGGVSEEVVEMVSEKASKLIEGELESLFKRSNQYRYFLRAISLGASTWSSIKRAVEIWIGRQLTNAETTRVLHRLIDLGIVEKTDSEYRITDPLIKEYCKKI